MHRETDRAPPLTPSEFRSARDRLIADRALEGVACRRALCDLSDAWLASVFTAALRSTDGADREVALVALGGYGRGELWPNSDLDLAVVHRRETAAIARIAEAVWYPVWDTGVHLGHGVRSIDEAVGVIGDDIESSTELLDARLIAGDPGVAGELSRRVRAAWDATFDRSLRWLHADADARRERIGDVAYAMEPNLKSGGGGLRDAQIPSWLGVGRDLIDPGDAADLEAARIWLGDVRLALHRCSPAAGDVLHLEEQDAVADTLGVDDADVLMTAVAGAARRVDWVLDEVWARATAIDRRPRWRRRRTKQGVAGRPGSQSRTDAPSDATDPAAVLRHAADAGRARRRLDRATLAGFAAATPTPDEPWDDATRDAFVALLSAGGGMIRVVEALDQVGVWERFVPEWPAVSSRAQRTPYHRFTVDRHLLETVVLATELGDRVARPDLLVVAALLHDLGKGRGGDHTEIGVHLAGVVATRMGFDAADTAVLTRLVGLHLLLPEAATRRDLDDPATIASVAASVDSVELLTLLAALTEADARATGPAAWTEWKAGLVHTLIYRVDAQLSGAGPGRYARAFPSPEQERLLRDGARVVRGTGRTLTVVAPFHRRSFCRVAGALVLAGLDVTAAMATTSEDMALEEFTVAPAFAPADDAEHVEIDWPAVTAAVEAALTGRVAIAARVAARVATYRQRPRGADDSVRVHFDDVGGDGSAVATVVEVDAPDRIGVLFAITQALAELDVEIRYARIETRTDRVTDAFSIVDADGATIRDDSFRAEINRAIHHALES